MQEIDSKDDFQDNDIEIVDLDVPDKGFSHFLFSLGKKGSFATSRRALPLLFICVLGLFVVLLQPGSSPVSHQPAVSHSSATTSSSFSQSLTICAINIIATPGQPVIFSRTPVLTYACSNGTVLPSLSGRGSQKP
jgi:hypothetical protein